MTMQPTEEAIRDFDRLVPKAAELHGMTWCVKRSWAIWTQSLRGRECLRCNHYVGNDGICDPL